MQGGMHHHAMHSFHSKSMLHLPPVVHLSTTSRPLTTQEVYTHLGTISNTIVPHLLGHLVAFEGPLASSLLCAYRPIYGVGMHERLSC